MIILIDNGHGKDTAGKRSPYAAYKTAPALSLYEWEWTREIAKRLEAGLKALGITAERIVKEDYDVSLSERCRRVNTIARSQGKDNVLLISIHADAFGDGKNWNDAHGWSAYTSKGKTKSDALAECLYSAAEYCFKGKTIRRDKSDGDSDKEADFYILKNTTCPAVLTENFFYTNIDDTKFILSEEGKKAVVECHINAIVHYLQEHNN